MSVDRLRQRLHRTSGDDGITLIELLVVGAISSILLAAVGITFTGSLKASQAAGSRVTATAETRVAMEVMASRLRVAVRPPDLTTADSNDKVPSIITVAGSDRLEFYASTGPGPGEPVPSRVQYWIERVGQSVAGSPAGTANCLRERVRPHTAAAPAPGPDTADPGRCIAFGVITAPLFSYYTGVPQPTEADPTPAVTQPSLLPVPEQCLEYAAPSGPECDAIFSVQVDLRLQALGQGSGNPLATSTRILLVNRHNEELA